MATGQEEGVVVTTLLVEHCVDGKPSHDVARAAREIPAGARFRIEVARDRDGRLDIVGYTVRDDVASTSQLDLIRSTV